MTSPYTPQINADAAALTRQRISGALVMGWLFALFALTLPRITIVGFWIFSDLLGDAYDSWVIPAIGFLILPWTTMTYALMWGISSDRVSGAEWIAVGVAVVLDVATYAGLRALASTD